jgi:hypothetical protein
VLAALARWENSRSFALLRMTKGGRHGSVKQIPRGDDNKKCKGNGKRRLSLGMTMVLGGVGFSGRAFLGEGVR